MLNLNFNQPDDQEKKDQKWRLPILAAVFILIIFVLGSSLMFFEIYYNNRFFPGSRIGSFDLSGLTKDQAFKLIDKQIINLQSDSLKIKYQENNEAKIVLINSLSNSDLAKDFFEYDAYNTIYNNYELGRNKGFLTNLFNQSLIYFGIIKMKAVYSIDDEYIIKTIKEQIGNLEVKEQDALPKITCLTTCQIEIIPEKTGLNFDYNQAINDWKNGLNVLLNNPIDLELIVTQPKITKQESEKLINGLSLIFTTSSDVIFTYQNDNFKLSCKKLAEMIYFERNKDKVYFAVNKEIFSKWFNGSIGEKINIEPQNATLEISNGKITKLSAHKAGQKADLDQAYTDLNNAIITGNFSNLNFTIKVNESLPEVATGDVNDLGIKEILGTGESNFAGSPTNRRKNIKNGANKLHGLLIKPNEEFSLVKALLPVDAANGYFPELVIKGNKTIPEYGGGLCQVGTTMFRAALASGLPILERQNHSYSVTYYLENGLPGIDATIYDPKPDFRFKNDTGNYILIQSRIVGDKLYFDFWGLKDGRVVNRTKPKTWGVRAPAPTKIIETTDLPVGQKKCTESSHNGISASFDYIVVYSDGKVATTTFTSVYKPWQAVCLLGVSASVSSTTDVVDDSIDN